MFGASRNRTALVQLAAISWNFGWPVVAGVVVGWWIDEKLGSSPVATLALGLGSMMTAVWRLVVLSRRDAVERRAEEAKGRGGENRGAPVRFGRSDDDRGGGGGSPGADDES